MSGASQLNQTTYIHDSIDNKHHIPISKSALSLRHSNQKAQSSFSEDELPKPNPPQQQQRDLPASLSPLTKTAPQQVKQKDKQHYTRANSNISFGEWSFGSGTTSSSHQHHHRSHKRVHSWSENKSNRSSSISVVDENNRRSHDSARTTIVGIHNQFHPPNGSTPPHGKQYVKTKTKIKTNKRFHRIVLAQTLAIDTTEYDVHGGIVPTNKEEAESPMGAIWCSRFSKDGKYMATGGQSCVLNIWKVLRDMDRKNDPLDDMPDLDPHQESIKVFHDAPVRVYTGHTADILDISWSKNNFIVSSSMDKTVRLWHVSQKVCLCVFRHLDVVPSVKFHPKDDRFFLSGSLDCKVRLWSIPEKRVAFWNEIPAGNMVTSVGFTLDGRTACAGSNTGDVFFFETQGLKYNTQIMVKSSHHKRGKKVTGIEPMPGMPPGEERILVTTNDSRSWMINMKDKSFVQKYKGLENPVMQIKASFSDDGRYIICGSEDGCVYLWCTDQVSYSPFQHLHESRIKAAVALGHLGDQMLATVFQQQQQITPEGVTGWLKRGERRVIDKLRSRNEHFLAHQHIVTSAIFAPTKTRQQLAKAQGDIIFQHTPVYTHKDLSCADTDDQESDSAYEDAHSRRSGRKTVSAASFNSRRNSERHLNQMDELRQTLMNEFEEATKEERDMFDYPDSQIIISADLHGGIKVWRMDSGVYNGQQQLLNVDNSESSDYGTSNTTTTSTSFATTPTKQVYSSASSPNLFAAANASLDASSTSKSKSKRPFSGLFSRRK